MCSCESRSSVRPPSSPVPLRASVREGPKADREARSTAFSKSALVTCYPRQEYILAIESYPTGRSSACNSFSSENSSMSACSTSRIIGIKRHQRSAEDSFPATTAINRTASGLVIRRWKFAESFFTHCFEAKCWGGGTNSLRPAEDPKREVDYTDRAQPGLLEYQSCGLRLILQGLHVFLSTTQRHDPPRN